MMELEQVRVRFVRQDGKELAADETDWGLTAIDGAAAPQYQVYTSDQARGDGSFVSGRRVAARDLEFSAAVMDAGSNAVLRKAALSFFSAWGGVQDLLNLPGNDPLDHGRTNRV